MRSAGRGWFGFGACVVEADEVAMTGEGFISSSSSFVE